MEHSSDGGKKETKHTLGAEGNRTVKNKPACKSMKRKCVESTSSSDDEEMDILPDNMLETEKHLHASAVKNNLDETSVRKILKKVVTNDHVLALVKLREEEEKGLNIDKMKPTKLTRSKIKELMKDSPKPSSWKTWDLQLTPIKHIPVKTRPEVTALIAQELPEDEDDEEYEPTHDETPSDDDQTVESSSDIESQPHTPGTPKSLHKSSPRVVKDGPFVIPQSVSGIKRKLELDEDEPTIARRTRSKLCLSATPIEHIESTFVPPDEPPMPDVDDLWNEFLNECLNPASTSKNEDDDEADPEYNVAADLDAANADDEDLGNSIIKISKKELNDLVTELFGILPEGIESEGLTENLTNTVLTETSQNEITHWEGKKEPVSDDECRVRLSDLLIFEKRDTNTRLSIGKSEKDDGENNDNEESEIPLECTNRKSIETPSKKIKKAKPVRRRNVTIAVKSTEESETMISDTDANSLPPVLLRLHSNIASKQSEVIQVEIKPDFMLLEEQILILQQQLRQHIQLATTNFLQLYVHPMHWKFGPSYKDYIETFIDMCETNPNSVANVCNLRPSLELINTWEKTVAADNPENNEMIEFVQKHCEKSRRRVAANNLYGGEFHDTFKHIVANSSVFLYPHLLPPVPYRADMSIKKFAYTRSEDELIAIGLDEFWKYVDMNPEIYKGRKNIKSRRRPGFHLTVQLLVKHMFPWQKPKLLTVHILNIKKNGDVMNPINKFFKYHKVEAVKHELLPFNPKLTLYEQPEIEMPRAWIRYLSKTSKRFKSHLIRSTHLSCRTPQGVPVNIGKKLETPTKDPLPIDFLGQPTDLGPFSNPTDKVDISINTGKPTENAIMATNLYSVVETSTGGFLVPLANLLPTNVVNSINNPISTPVAINATVVGNNLPENSVTLQPKDSVKEEEIQKVDLDVASTKQRDTIESTKTDVDHCKCCRILRKICDKGQKSITDYFRTSQAVSKSCYCKSVKHPKITNRLKLLINHYSSNDSKVLYDDIENMMSKYKTDNETSDSSPANDLVFVICYQLKLLRRISVYGAASYKQNIHGLFSQFDLEKDNPVALARNLQRLLKKDLFEVYSDFLGFLSAEQAEAENVFNAYLKSHLSDLMKVIEEDMIDNKKRCVMLNQLKTVLTDKISTPCQTCSTLLSKMDGHPRIAKYLFSLFTHKQGLRRTPNLSKPTTILQDIVPVTRQAAQNNILLNSEQLAAVQTACKVSNTSAKIAIKPLKDIVATTNPKNLNKIKIKPLTALQSSESANEGNGKVLINEEQETTCETIQPQSETTVNKNQKAEVLQASEPINQKNNELNDNIQLETISESADLQLKPITNSNQTILVFQASGSINQNINEILVNKQQDKMSETTPPQLTSIANSNQSILVLQACGSIKQNINEILVNNQDKISERTPPQLKTLAKNNQQILVLQTSGSLNQNNNEILVSNGQEKISETTQPQLKSFANNNQPILVLQANGSINQNNEILVNKEQEKQVETTEIPKADAKDDQSIIIVQPTLSVNKTVDTTTVDNNETANRDKQIENIAESSHPQISTILKDSQAMMKEQGDRQMLVLQEQTSQLNPIEPNKTAESIPLQFQLVVKNNTGLIASESPESVNQDKIEINASKESDKLDHSTQNRHETDVKSKNKDKCEINASKENDQLDQSTQNRHEDTARSLNRDKIEINVSKENDQLDQSKQNRHEAIARSLNRDNIEINALKGNDQLDQSTQNRHETVVNNNQPMFILASEPICQEKNEINVPERTNQLRQIIQSQLKTIVINNQPMIVIQPLNSISEDNPEINSLKQTDNMDKAKSSTLRTAIRNDQPMIVIHPSGDINQEDMEMHTPKQTEQLHKIQSPIKTIVYNNQPMIVIQPPDASEEIDHSEPMFVLIKTEPEDDTIIKCEPTSDDEAATRTTNRENVNMSSDCTDMSMVIVENIKSEPVEWTRHEDKLILEILREYLTPEERQYKTIVDILEEQNVIQLIATYLKHKSIENVQERIIYLLEFLVNSGQ